MSNLEKKTFANEKMGKAFDNWMTSCNINFLSFINARIYAFWKGVQMPIKISLQMAEIFLHVMSDKKKT